MKINRHTQVSKVMTVSGVTFRHVLLKEGEVDSGGGNSVTREREERGKRTSADQVSGTLHIADQTGRACV